MAKDIQKDYMGLISWNRVSCGSPQPMFGSEIKTDAPVCIRISKAYISDLSTPTDQKISADHPAFIEVELTPIQWAEFLTAGHTDDGVPCTITRIDGKRMSPVEMRNIAEEYDTQTNLKFEAFQNNITNLEKFVGDILDSGKTMNKSQMKELLHNLQCTRSKTVGDVKYLKEQFREDMAKVVVKAKAEVNAYAELRLKDSGVKCIMSEDANDLQASIGEEK